MPTGQADPSLTIAQMEDEIARVLPTYYPTAARVLPLVKLGLARKLANDPEIQPDEEMLATFANATPAFQLLTALDDDLQRWAPWMSELVPEITSVKAYSREYRYAFTRCVQRAVSGGLISDSSLGMSPAWLEARTWLANNLPFTDPILDALLAEGRTEYYGRPLNRSSRLRTKNEFRIMLHGFTVMARYMTGKGILEPVDVLPEHICGRGESWYEERKRGREHDMKVYYTGKQAWEILRQACPDLGLIDWPTPNEHYQFGLKVGERPPLLEQMLDELEQMNVLDEGTMRNVRVHTHRMMGYYQKVLGFDVPALCDALDDPQDLAYLLYAPYPQPEDYRIPESLVEVRRVFEDPSYRRELLRTIPRAVRRNGENEPCRSNPFIELYTEWNIERKAFGTGDGALSSFRIAAQNYLNVSPSQFEWFRRLRRKNRNNKKRSPAVAWRQRKDILARDHELWKKVVSALPRMAKYSSERHAEMLAATDDESRRDRAMHWAVALRDQLAISFLLCFQFRSKNIARMRLGEELMIDQHVISIPGFRAKNGTRINKRFPERGVFADLKTLLELYVEEARPHLLPKGSESPYLLLPFPSERMTKDKDGHVMISMSTMGRLVRRACERHLKDILPSDLDRLTSHTFRDLFANLGFRQPGGTAMASQALANSVEVLIDHYVGVDRTGDHEVRRFIEEINVSTGKDATARRKEFRERLEDALGSGASAAKIHELMKLYDQREG